MSIGGPKIPQALEKILQLKEIRQEQLVEPAGLCRSLTSVSVKGKEVSDPTGCFSVPSDDDDDDDGDLNSGAMSSERDDHDLSKRDVSLCTPKLHPSARARLTSATRNLLSEKPQAPQPQEEEQAEARSGEEGAGGAAAEEGGCRREGGGEGENFRGGYRVRHGGAGDLRPQLHLLQEDLRGLQGDAENNTRK